MAQAYDIAIAFDPSNEELQRARGDALYRVTKSRAGDPSNLPQTMRERLENYNNNQGGAVTEELLEQMLAQLGTDDESGNGDALRARMLVENSSGLPRFEEAFALYLKAANKGHTEAMLQVGVMYSEGQGVKRDLQKAAQWFEKLANCPISSKYVHTDMNVANGQYSYGLCLLDGIGVPQDVAKGIEWLTRAAELGDFSALFTLGNMFLSGRQVPKDVKRGFDMIKDAALRGLAIAMDTVGSCYATGRGVTKDFNEARKWFERALKAGYHRSHANLALLKDLEANEPDSSGLTDDQVAAARKLVEVSMDAPSVSTMVAGSFSKEVQAIYDSVVDSTTEFGKRLLEGLSHMLRAFQVVAHCATDGVSESMGLLFVEEFAAAAKVSEKLLIVPQPYGPVIQKLINCALRNHDTEDIALCQALIMVQNPAQIPAAMTLLRKATRKFPNSAVLFKVYATTLVLCGKTDQSLEALKQGIKVSAVPDPSLLLPQAQCYRMLEQHRSAITAYLACIACTEPEAFERPDAFFGLAASSIALGKIDDAEKYFNQGVESQQQQLKAFRNERNNVKQYVETMLRTVKPGFGSKPKVASKSQTVPNKASAPQQSSASGQTSSTTTEPYRNLDRLNNMNRITLLNQHRNFFTNVLRQQNYVGAYSATPPRKSTYSGSAAKEIFLQDMDWTADRVYKGYFMRVTVITRVMKLASYITIIEDDKGDAMRAAFYFEIGLNVGTKLVIYNPYMRQAANDNQPVIRVDDANTVEVEPTKYSNVCWYCGVPDTEKKLLKCSRCPAHYCSKECQTTDWKKLNHKLICFKE